MALSLMGYWTSVHDMGGQQPIILPDELYFFSTYSVDENLVFSTEDFRGRHCYRTVGVDGVTKWEEMYFGTLAKHFAVPKGNAIVSHYFTSYVNPDGVTVTGTEEEIMARLSPYFKLEFGILAVAICGPTGNMFDSRPDNGFVINEWDEEGQFFWSAERIIRTVAQDFDENYNGYQSIGSGYLSKFNGRLVTVLTGGKNAVAGFYEPEQAFTEYMKYNLPRESLLYGGSLDTASNIVIRPQASDGISFAFRGNVPALSLQYYVNDRLSIYHNVNNGILTLDPTYDYQHYAGNNGIEKYFWFKYFSEVIL